MTPWQKQLSSVKTHAEESATTVASDKYETARNQSIQLTELDDHIREFNDSQLLSSVQNPRDQFYLTQREIVNYDQLQPVVCKVVQPMSPS